jgi:hypothetical protein
LRLRFGSAFSSVEASEKSIQNASNKEFAMEVFCPICQDWWEWDGTPYATKGKRPLLVYPTSKDRYSCKDCRYKDEYIHSETTTDNALVPRQAVKKH